MQQKIQQINTNIQDIKTPVVKGVSSVFVDLIQSLENPYYNLTEMALTTWGDTNVRKWKYLTPQERFEVTKNVLMRKALPLGKESLIFLFAIEGVSRGAFDQIARQRIGATFSSLSKAAIRQPNSKIIVANEVIKNKSGEVFCEELSRITDDIKKLYYTMLEQGISWQAAGQILPLDITHNFTFSVTFEALTAFCGRRLCFSEQEDTVAVAWLMRQRIKEQFPLLASFLRPACDFANVCLYHNPGSLPEKMGALFSSCGRHKARKLQENAIAYKFPSTNKNDLENQLSITIPSANDDAVPEVFEMLTEKDQLLFYANYK